VHVPLRGTARLKFFVYFVKQQRKEIRGVVLRVHRKITFGAISS
jgi:hypothetical protein